MNAERKRNGWMHVRHVMPTIGDVAKRKLYVSEGHLALCTEMSGDRNPLHTDRRTAESRKGEVCVSGEAATYTAPLLQ